MAQSDTQILAGDCFDLDVSPRRMIPAGHYHAMVIAQLPALPCEPYRYCLLVQDFSCPRHFYIVLTVPTSPELLGYGFLGSDEYPVAIHHTPDLLSRLYLSLQRL